MKDSSSSKAAGAAASIEDVLKPDGDVLKPDKDDCDNVEMGDDILSVGVSHPSLLHPSSVKDETVDSEHEAVEHDDQSYASDLPEAPAEGLRRSRPGLQTGPGAFAISPSGANRATATMSQRSLTEYSITESEQVSNQQAYAPENVPEAPEVSQTSNHAYETIGELVPHADPVDAPPHENSDQNADHDPEIPTVVGKAVDEVGKLKRKKQVRMFIILLGIAALVAIVTAITLAVLLQGADDPVTTGSPTTSPSALPTTSYEGLVIDTLVDSGVNVSSILERGQVDQLFANQRRAILWLTETDRIDFDLRSETSITNSTQISPSGMLLERYAALVVLFSLAAGEPISIIGEFDSVCDWNLNGGGNGFSCDENGSVMNAWLGRNNFEGTLATEIGMFNNLQGFAIDNNQKAHSTIPSELFRISTLSRAFLGGNELTGTIPTEIQNTQSLTWLYVNDNHLTGSLPTEIGSLSLLVQLSTRNNLMSGTIPTEIGRMTKLSAPDLEGNDYKGSIPSEIGLMTDLLSINLHHNRLTSSIPSEVGNLHRLEHIGMYRNLLTGTLPTTLGKCQSLKALNLFGNQGILGSIPSELGLLPLATVFIGNTSLTGTVPTSFRNTNSSLQFIAYKTPPSGSVDEIFCNREKPLNLLIFDFCLQGEFEKSNVTCSCCTRCGGFFSVEQLSSYEEQT